MKFPTLQRQFKSHTKRNYILSKAFSVYFGQVLFNDKGQFSPKENFPQKST